MGISDKFDAATRARCKGDGCRFTHVSGVPRRKYGHVAVLAGITPLLSENKAATDAWVKVMKGRGQEVFHGPYGQG